MDHDILWVREKIPGLRRGRRDRRIIDAKGVNNHEQTRANTDASRRVEKGMESTPGYNGESVVSCERDYTGVFLRNTKPLTKPKRHDTLGRRGKRGKRKKENANMDSTTMFDRVAVIIDELNAHLDNLRNGVLAQESKERTLARVDYIITLVRG
jgi:hypothetical protein